MLGWTATPFDAGPTPYRVLSVPGNESGFGGMLRMDEQWAGVPSHWSIYLHVTDVETILAKTVALGGRSACPRSTCPAWAGSPVSTTRPAPAATS